MCLQVTNLVAGSYNYTAKATGINGAGSEFSMLVTGVNVAATSTDPSTVTPDPPTSETPSAEGESMTYIAVLVGGAEADAAFITLSAVTFQILLSSCPNLAWVPATVLVQEYKFAQVVPKPLLMTMHRFGWMLNMI